MGGLAEQLTSMASEDGFWRMKRVSISAKRINLFCLLLPTLLDV
jgi:hypothetical protein